jgi:hypothetical protein
MQPHSFSKRHLAVIALMLDEEEKNAALSDKKKRCEFTSVSEAENQKDRMEEWRDVCTLKTSEIFRNSSRHSGR